VTLARLYGVLGWPVAHSRSPAMHRAAFAARGIAGEYLPFAVPPDRLEAAVAGLVALGAGGANVTLPHKRSVMQYLAEVDPDAALIGAVNTLVPIADGFRGENTDAPGLVAALAEHDVVLADAVITVLGGGGAARAVVVGCARAGAARVTVATRRPEQGVELVDDLREHVGSTSLEAAPLDENL
jgi:shikimate dehydrogenase